MTIESRNSRNVSRMNVFAYGSLMFEDIFLEVTGTSLDAIRATATGWRRFSLEQRTYPGAVPSDKHCIDGVLWLDVPERALLALDQFEGDEYVRRQIEVLDSAGHNYVAFIYQWLDLSLTLSDWSIQEFESEHRRGFASLHRPKTDLY